MRVIAGRHGPLSKISRGQCQKGGAYYTRGNQFSLRIWLKKRGADYTRVLIIRGKRRYIGLSSTELKTRYYNHVQSFEHREKRNATELSKAVWRAKDAGVVPRIDWCITAKAQPHHPGSKTCNLCLEEKLAIIQADPTSTLNKRSELIGKCRHKSKFKLKSLI